MTESTNAGRVWFITGTSTGFGRALAEEALKRGDRVIATARDLEQVRDIQQDYPEHAQAIRLDVTDLDEVRQSVEAAVETFGQIDVVVNNAGYGLLGAIEEVSEEDMRRQVEVNLFGVLNVTRAVLPYMREQRSGHFVNISSVGGFVGVPGFGIYNATKFGVEGLSEGLALEAAPLGIHVTIVEPGAFRTDWAGRSLTRAGEIEDYNETVGGTREYIESENGSQQGDPVLAARAMIAAVEADEPPLRLPLGQDSLDQIREKLDEIRQETDAWERTTVETTFEHSGR